MAEIFVEGIGTVEIKGTAPTVEESQAIAGLLSGEQKPQAGPPGIPAPLTGKPRIIPKSRTGLIPESIRGSIRQAVQDLPGVPRFGAEVAPSVGGALAGGALGALTGPAAPIAIPLFAGAGGLLGEFMAQETGVTPQSDVSLGLSGAAPLAGGLIAKPLARLGGAALTKIPPAAAAQARTVAQKATEQFESLGAKILGKQKGLLARPASEIYGAARSAGVKVRTSQLSGTMKALQNLRTELGPLSAVPEAAQALKIVEQSLQTLGGKEGLRITAVNFDTVIGMRQLLGRMVKRVEKTGGVRLGTAKQAFKAMADDMDKIAKGSTRARRPARLAQMAAKRAKLEFSIRDMERAVARFSHDIPGKDAAALNVKGFQKWLRDVTNPKSKVYDKNFSTALKTELPGIKKNLIELAKATEKSGSPAGPGSIVVRGIGAKTGRTIIGGLIGAGAAGPLGAGVGALAGASLPEMMTALFMSRAGAFTLAKAAKLGKGNISAQRWSVLTQAITRAAGVAAPEIDLGGPNFGG